MTNGVPGALYHDCSCYISVLIMMQFAVPVGKFVNTHHGIQILIILFDFNWFYAGLPKVLIYLMLLVFGSHVTPVPKGYLYFAIFLSLVEVLKT
jgi:hypothetical protein